MTTYTHIVVGAGVVGCSIARELSKYGRTLVIEQHDLPGQETSLRNSGVIHSGIHLPPHFLKARLARDGGPRVIEFCRQHDVPHKEVGMHIVIGSRDILNSIGEFPAFLRLLRRAREQKIKVRLKSGYATR